MKDSVNKILSKDNNIQVKSKSERLAEALRKNLQRRKKAVNSDGKKQ